MEKILINDTLGEVSILWNKSQEPKYTMVLAHGAGAGMDHSFMESVAWELSHLNGNIIRFNFPYKESGQGSPGSPKNNIETIRVIKDYAMKSFNQPVFLAGKSYGGRMSSHLVSSNQGTQIAGLVYFGFPLHAPGRDSIDRAAHLDQITVPQLFLQGTKDKLANFGLMQEVVAKLSNAEIFEIESGDHSFKVPKKLGLTQDDIIKTLATKTNTWILELLS